MAIRYCYEQIHTCLALIFNRSRKNLSAEKKLAKWIYFIDIVLCTWVILADPWNTIKFEILWVYIDSSIGVPHYAKFKQEVIKYKAKK